MAKGKKGSKSRSRRAAKKGTAVTIGGRKYKCHAKKVGAFGRKGSKKRRNVVRAFCARHQK